MKFHAAAPLFILLAVLAGTGCERHPASQTVPGYAEKAAAKEKKEQHDATTPEGTNPEPPSYFPPKGD
jgi:hypothetical protein